MNQDQIESFMRNFPPRAQVLSMEAEDLGAHMLRYMTTAPHAETHRFNFMQMVEGGQIAERFMEAWGWLEREGFIAHRPNDIHGQGFFVTRAGRRVAQSIDFGAWKKESMFPDGLDPIVMAQVKPLFVRGDYDTAVFRAFKEVEVRLRAKDASLAPWSGVDLINRAFGPNGCLMTTSAKERASMRDLFVGAFAIFRNPSAHQEVKFDDPREVVDMICFANQLLRMIDRI
ncbi:TIGR02391 family protein [Bradyrhizobium guangdongense]|uniref:TIGR02391 family protein n=1 Tax=Bradyrhizobium guangdongense TaxID=1325090 RepID=UPI0011266195|nr:TIGR02391 family protein [Bradyrhizobium guangdongense]TPQ31531.1 TIGR02391 family protein [Bradyrhizobium guangdongense]